jgi:hypothetical protein
MKLVSFLFALSFFSLNKSLAADGRHVSGTTSLGIQPNEVAVERLAVRVNTMFSKSSESQSSLASLVQKADKQITEHCATKFSDSRRVIVSTLSKATGVQGTKDMCTALGLCDEKDKFYVAAVRMEAECVKKK